MSAWSVTPAVNPTHAQGRIASMRLSSEITLQAGITHEDRKVCLRTHGDDQHSISSCGVYAPGQPPRSRRISSVCVDGLLAGADASIRSPIVSDAAINTLTHLSRDSLIESRATGCLATRGCSIEGWTGLMELMVWTRRRIRVMTGIYV